MTSLGRGTTTGTPEEPLTALQVPSAMTVEAMKMAAYPRSFFVLLGCLFVWLGVPSARDPMVRQVPTVDASTAQARAPLCKLQDQLK